MPRIIGVSGSLRDGSHNTNLLLEAAALLPPGVALDLYTELRDLPPYDADRDVEPVDPTVARLREAIADADGVLPATPEYNGSIPGVLKNALDWASRPFPENAAPGQARRGDRGLYRSLRGSVGTGGDTKVLGVIGADVIDRELPVGQAEPAFAERGGLLGPEQRAELAELVGVLPSRTGAKEARVA